MDFHNEEFRRMYERTLILILLKVMDKRYPGRTVRVVCSMSHGVLIHSPDQSYTEKELAAIEADMRDLTARDLPFESMVLSKEEAISYFEKRARAEKADLLRFHGKSTITLYGVDGYFDDLFGPVLPSTGCAAVFAVYPMRGSFILQRPDRNHPEKPYPFIALPKHMSTFIQSEAWSAMLNATNAADMEKIAKNGDLRMLVRVMEALHDSAIHDIAREIGENERRIVLVAGPSSSGKTTFAARLCVHLQVLGIPSLRISMDDYYIDRSLRTPDENGKLDFETIEALDIPLLQQQLTDLMEGKCVAVPRYDFKTGSREKEGVSTQISPEHVVVVEGIHALNPILSDRLPRSLLYRVYVSALTCQNLDDHNRIHTTDIRLLRRIVRDYQFRGTMPVETMNMWEDVRTGEERWIFPYQENADSVFNTMLTYEIPLLRSIAYPLLLEESCKDHVLTERLLTLLNCYSDFDQNKLNEIPPLSLIREFIGGCTAEKR